MATTISIRRSLLTNLVAVVVLLGLGIITMMALSTRRAVQDLSGLLITQASRRTEVKLQGFFRPVNRQVEAVRMWGDSGILDLSTPDELRQLLTPLMREFPWSSATFVANEQGRDFSCATKAATGRVVRSGARNGEAEPSRLPGATKPQSRSRPRPRSNMTRAPGRGTWGRWSSSKRRSKQAFQPRFSGPSPIGSSPRVNPESPLRLPSETATA